MEIIIALLSLIIIILIIKKISLKNRLNSILDENKNLKEKLKNYDELSKENIILKEKLTLFEKIEKELKEENKNLNSQKEQILNENISLKEEISSLKTEIKKQKEYIEEKESFFNKKFEEISNAVLEKTQSKTLSSIENVLSPIQKELITFKSRIEDLSKEETKEINILLNEIQNIKELNKTLSKEAKELANALKNDKKKQGIWGEIVLKKVLQMSGLREGIEFKTEVKLENLRPDVVIYLPENREIIIDAKTSLNSFVNYINEQKEEYLTEFIKNIETHIKKLSEKDYEKLLKNSVDFIIMFIPIENALNIAIENKPELFDFAIKKKIILASPTNLLTILKSIDISFKYKKQLENIEDIIKSSENIYTKFVNFLGDFEKIEKYLNLTSKNYEEAKKKLTTGRGNLIKQLENLKEKSAITPKKTIPSKLLLEE